MAGAGLLFVFAGALLLVAAPAIERIQRLSRPAEGAVPFGDARAAETALQPPSAASNRPASVGGRAPAGPLIAPDQIGSPPVTADSPDPGVDYGEPTWLTIPTIDLDTPIGQVGVKDGFYQTAAFRAGHHADSVDPGQLGNSVFNGHVTSLTEGRIFARLNEVRPGDAIAIYTADYRTDWSVVAAGWAPADQSWYIQPFRDIRVTLYTCGGYFDFRRLDYTHRFVVVAGLVRAVPLASPPADAPESPAA